MLQKANSIKELKKSLQTPHAPSMRYSSKITSLTISFCRRKSLVPLSTNTMPQYSGQPITRYFPDMLHRSCTHCTQHHHVLQKEQSQDRWEKLLIRMQTCPTKRHLVSAHRLTCPHQNSTNSITENPAT